MRVPGFGPVTLENVCIVDSCSPELCSTTLFSPFPWISLARVLTLAAAVLSGDFACMPLQSIISQDMYAG
jgi:predicted homoserine dehydrogenase-like protein